MTKKRTVIKVLKKDVPTCNPDSENIMFSFRISRNMYSRIEKVAKKLSKGGKPSNSKSAKYLITQGLIKESLK